MYKIVLITLNIFILKSRVMFSYQIIQLNISENVNKLYNSPYIVTLSIENVFRNFTKNSNLKLDSTV